ncbi:hypothetical protein [Variovorax sp. J31P207]|uniref:hypothetical protein n=1 Tax=Variovorax sp. J31P207 TaxID=3053510 RepID=UPI002578ECD5|nr:hypothetical protein [Variovorax sp. J31P207]MDM0065231.1 hypothetical protein [Variovorax sp. J31P207]
MNTAHIGVPERSDRFINLVDFKWLMAGMGWWVNLSRLQTDRDYIDECLQLAMTSDSELLQERSIEMLGLRGSDSHCDKVVSSRSLASAW